LIDGSTVSLVAEMAASVADAAGAVSATADSSVAAANPVAITARRIPRRGVDDATG
jgi:hypothetical protein